MITYKNDYDANHDIESVRVYLDKRFTGTIEKHEGGWRYTERTGKGHGETLPSINAVMRSLESV